MRPATATQGVPDGPVRVEFEVQFSRGPKGRRRVPEARVETPAPRTKTAAAPKLAPLNLSSVPSITRLLVLGYHLERLVLDGVVKDYAEIARMTGTSRARVTQIVALTLLAPATQESLLVGDTRDHNAVLPDQRTVRRVTSIPNWNQQRSFLRRHSDGDQHKL